MLNKKHLFAALKIALVGVLFTVIFYNISWVDSYSHVDPQGTVLAETEGQIVGPWDQDRVQFLVKGATRATDLFRGVQADGTTIAFSPGLPTYVRNLDIALFALGAALFFVFVVLINSRWWFLLRANGLGVGFFEAQKFGWIGLFFSNVVPGATGGDVVKAVYIVRRCSGDKVRAVVSIVVDRILGVMSLLLVGSLASTLAMDRFPVFASTMWLTGLGVLLFCFLLISPTLRRLLRFDELITKLPGKVETFIRDLDAAILHYRKHLLGITGWILVSPAIYTLLVGSFFCMSEALGVGITLADLFFIVPVASVIQG
ncbi:MAG: flippase-like domain-containing protein, partial [Proteobacteria bacterium]|nr:flippase-like domain-containing protein [Pseudomonadota bacterium]